MLRFFAIALLSASAFGQAANVYITQNGAGSGNGTSSGNAGACDATANTPQTTCAFFNNSSNWGAGSTQIGAGTVVHVSGTITYAANAVEYFTFQAGGTSGNPITWQGDSTTNITGPVVASGDYLIYSSGHNYITINGGATGSASPAPSTFTGGATLQTTANGTGLTYQTLSNGVGLYNCSNCTVENITIGPIYVHTCTLPVTNCTDEAGDPTGAIYVQGGSNLVVTNVVAHDMKWCIEYNFNNGNTNVQFYGNLVYNVDHGFVIAPNGTGAAFTDGYVYNNTYHDPGNWDDAGDDNHHDGVHLWTFNSGNSLTHSYVYNNYFYGNFGVNMNSAVYEEDLGNTVSACDAWVFNNVVAPSAGETSGNGMIGLGANSGLGCWSNLNNTEIDYSNTVATGLNANTTTGTTYNNIVDSTNSALGGYNVNGTAIDYQDYYNIGSGGWNGGSSLSGWVTYCQANFASMVGCDAHSIGTNPSLVNAANCQSGTLSACKLSSTSSPAYQFGKNLYSTCNGQATPGLGALCSDAAGNVRPTSGNWDGGAFQYTSGTTYTLSVAATGAGGSVSDSNSVIVACTSTGGTCSGSTSGSDTLTATITGGWSATWGGACSGNASTPCSLTISAATNVTITFTQNPTPVAPTTRVLM